MIQRRENAKDPEMDTLSNGLHEAERLRPNYVAAKAGVGTREEADTSAWETEAQLRAKRKSRWTLPSSPCCQRPGVRCQSFQHSPQATPLAKRLKLGGRN